MPSLFGKHGRPLGLPKVGEVLAVSHFPGRLDREKRDGWFRGQIAAGHRGECGSISPRSGVTGTELGLKRPIGELGSALQGACGYLHPEDMLLRLLSHNRGLGWLVSALTTTFQHPGCLNLGMPPNYTISCPARCPLGDIHPSPRVQGIHLAVQQLSVTWSCSIYAYSQSSHVSPSTT